MHELEQSIISCLGTVIVASATCRKKCTEDDAGPFNVKKQKTQKKKIGTQKEEDPCKEEAKEGRGKPTSHCCDQHQKISV